MLSTLLLCVACGGPEAPEVPRKLEGKVVRGAFVSPYSYEWVVRAERAMSLGDFEHAVLAFQHARSGAEEDPWLFARLVRAQTCAGQLRKAKQTLKEAFEHFPRQRWLQLERDFLNEVTPILSAPSDENAARVRDHCTRYFGDERSFRSGPL